VEEGGGSILTWSIEVGVVDDDGAVDTIHAAEGREILFMSAKKSVAAGEEDASFVRERLTIQPSLNTSRRSSSFHPQEG